MRCPDMTALLLIVAGSLTLVGASGCAEKPVEFLEVHRLNDALGESDIELLERIAGQLRGERLPEMAPHFVPAPSWSGDRPVSVATLAREELARVRTQTRLSHLTDSIAGEVRLMHLLKREGLTESQYAALVLAVGTAAQRARLDPAQDLESYVEVGRRHLKRLAGRDDSFATLTLQQKTDAVEEATWVTRVDRSERLLRIPAANVLLAEQNRERLEKVLPKSFLKHPLAGITVPILDAGVPFREAPETGFDSEMFWSVTDERAVIGGKSMAADPNSEWR